MITILEIAGLLILPGFLLLDLFHRQKDYKRPRFWRSRSLVVTIVAVATNIAVLVGWGMLLEDFHLFDLAGLGAWGAIAGILCYEVGHYLYHRAAHRHSRIWYLGHQMHHSAESIDAFSAFYLHPLDNVIFSTLSALLVYPLLGITPEAGAIVGFWLAVNATLQHANIATPHWIGYLIQRPESHRIHHARGIHRYNYANLPVIDMFFGTFWNPKECDLEAGFYDGASTRIGDMLLFRDVSSPADGEEAHTSVSPIY
ncbi:MAG: sterol desaturase family protein [Gammaproteobacteria bacterium]|nr:sterol desaturase family protein [Gammaproteobacteria bacterium]